LADAIQKRFDRSEPSLRRRAGKQPTDCPGVLLDIARWRKAPRQGEEGQRVERTAGTPQGGVVRPLLANLFRHDVFDNWRVRTWPEHPGARSADDGVVPCHPEAEAKPLRVAREERFTACGLRLHPDKTRSISCQEEDRRGTDPETRCDFLGSTWRPRRAKHRYGTVFVTCTPGVRNTAAKERRQTMHDWRMPLKPAKALEDLSRLCKPVLRGWSNSSGRLYTSAR
jgi:RNA-directed DNA polymerase